MAAVAALSVAVALSGCAPGQYREAAGGALGAVAGGLVGAQVGKGKGRDMATAAGAVIGALAGGAVGRHLDQAASEALEAAQLDALDRGEVDGPGIQWAAPSTSTTPASGIVEVVREGRTAGGSVCRETRTTATIQGRTETVLGSACRDASGVWRAVEG